MLRLCPQPTPFSIPESLRAFLLEDFMEYGTGGGIAAGSFLPCDTVWSITEGTDRDPIGFAWIAEHKGQYCVEGHHFVIAVFPEYQGSGVGTFALTEIERYARDTGLTALHAQVNFNQPEGGLRVRRWLLRHGFAVVREDATKLRERYASLDDDAYIRECVVAVPFRKTLA
jgi:GNAT superfamily N-acetyltransferase